MTIMITDDDHKVSDGDVEYGRYLDACLRWQMFGWLLKMADIWMIVEGGRYLDDC